MHTDAATSRWADYRWLILAIVAAAGLQVMLAARAWTISVDGTMFIDYARELTKDPLEAMRAHDQHPGYPALVAVGASVVKLLGLQGVLTPWIVGGQLVSGLCGVLSVLVLWFWARGLYGATVANVACWVLVLLPLFRMNAVEAQSDTPHLLLYLAAVWLATAGINTGRPACWIGAGLASGAAYWIRPEGLEVPLVAALLLCCPGEIKFKRRAVCMAALVVSTLAVAAPYCVLAGKFTSKQLPFAKRQPVTPFVTQQIAAAEALAPRSSAALAPNSAAQDGSASRPSSLAVVLTLLGKSLAELGKSFSLGLRYVFVPFYFLGLFEFARRRLRWRSVLLPAGLAALHIAVLLAVYLVSGYLTQRHLMVVFALALPHVALGLLYAYERLAARLGSARPAWAVAVLLLISLPFVCPRYFQPMNQEFRPLLSAIDWMRERTVDGDLVSTNSEYVAFYTGRPAELVSAATPISQLVSPTGMPRYRYVILDLHSHSFKPEWLATLGKCYQQSFEAEGPYKRNQPARVIVLQAKQSAQIGQSGTRPEREADLRARPAAAL